VKKGEKEYNRTGWSKGGVASPMEQEKAWPVRGWIEKTNKESAYDNGKGGQNYHFETISATRIGRGESLSSRPVV